MLAMLPVSDLVSISAVCLELRPHLLPIVALRAARIGAANFEPSLQLGTRSLQQLAALERRSSSLRQVFFEVASVGKHALHSMYRTGNLGRSTFKRILKGHTEAWLQGCLPSAHEPTLLTPSGRLAVAVNVVEKAWGYKRCACHAGLFRAVAMLGTMLVRARCRARSA